MSVPQATSLLNTYVIQHSALEANKSANLHSFPPSLGRMDASVTGNCVLGKMKV